MIHKVAEKWVPRNRHAQNHQTFKFSTINLPFFFVYSPFYLHVKWSF